MIIKALGVIMTTIDNLQQFIPKSFLWFVVTFLLIGIIVGLIIIRRMIRGERCTNKVQLDGKTAIVTGSNSGIGKETAREFYRRGARVILACRNLRRANEAARDIESTPTTRGIVVVYRLDLANFNSIREFSERVIEMEPRVDILVNNAGVISAKNMTVDGFDLVFQTNHLGHFLLTNLLLKKIVESAPSRIINVTSSLYTRATMKWNDLNLNKADAYGPWVAYCQSKLANILFTKGLAQKLTSTGYKNTNVYAVNPGPSNTGFFRNSSEYLPKIFRIFLKIIVPLLYKSPEQGAQTIIYCAVSNEEANRTGLYYNECKETRLSNLALDNSSIKKLWEISSEMVKLDTKAILSAINLNESQDSSIN